MKIWVETDGFGDAIIHLAEPQWVRVSWQNNLFEVVVCGDGWRRFSKLPQPNCAKHELQEIDLSGKKPRLVCTWVPA